jgi:S-adenosylmethionine:tRNA ribosyltransferase-isomerase
MRTDLFDFVLPEDRIALRPATPRDAARLLVVRAGVPAQLEDRSVRDLPELLRAGDAVVVNDTKVIPAFLHGRRIGRGEYEPGISANLIKRLDGSRWRALVKPARRLEAGDVVRFGSEGRVCFLDQLDATVEAKGEGGEITFAFAFHGAALDQALAERGDVPLPPYIAGRRAADEQDRSDYQTMFAREEGSVAAPTAGLHFTEAIVQALAARGGRIVAVGSTALRLVESAAAEDGTMSAFSGETALFITPGYRFRAADVMLTNFHLPRSTLFMLVCAFCGLETMQRAYAHAIETGYRFYSYGDACLLFRAS